jgi:hypothetical protein
MAELGGGKAMQSDEVQRQLPTKSQEESQTLDDRHI